MEALREAGMIHAKAMCIIVRDGKVLATEGCDDENNEKFYRLIGGGIHYQETSEDALRRELLEELETELANIRFLKVVENIFTYKGQPGHEIVFLYSADVVRKELYDSIETPIADHPQVKAVWVPIVTVIEGSARLYPKTDYSSYLVA